jgi:hypothetical protein
LPQKREVNIYVKIMMKKKKTEISTDIYFPILVSIILKISQNVVYDFYFHFKAKNEKMKSFVMIAETTEKASSRDELRCILKCDFFVFFASFIKELKTNLVIKNVI